MKSINDIQNEIINDFSMFDDWIDRYGYIIDLGKPLHYFHDKYKVDENLIVGCQSRTWLKLYYTDGRVYIHADSDSAIMKGIIALIIRIFEDRTPDEIINTDLYFIEKIGLAENLTAARSNGLVEIISKIKEYANNLN